MGAVNKFIQGGVRYKVIGAAVIAKRAQRTNVHLYRGQILPEDISPANIEHLLETGLIAAMEVK